MIALKALGTLALLGGIAIEAAGRHPGGYGFIANAGAVVAVVLWSVAVFAAERQTATRRERRR
jgi:hypothetical protein